MYDLIDIIDTKLSSMDHLIHKWMTENQLVKSTILNEIISIKSIINTYHNKYVICKYWEKYGQCKYGTHCWYLHPIKSNHNNNNNNSNNISSNENKERKENQQENSENENNNF